MLIPFTVSHYVRQLRLPPTCTIPVGDLHGLFVFFIFTGAFAKRQYA